LDEDDDEDNMIYDGADKDLSKPESKKPTEEDEDKSKDSFD
jgi:hypothetical protein